MFVKSLLGTVAAFALASAAQAAINVSVWTGQPAAGANATLAQAGSLGPATATTTVTTGFNFDSTVGGYTIGGFLNNPVGLNPVVAAMDLNNTYFYFTGSAFLNAGNNSFVVSHDDGLQLNIDGIGLVVDSPLPTSPVDTPFNVFAPSAGVYNFQLSYGEVLGPPAKLVVGINGINLTGVDPVPEPATWAMMLIGFGGIGMTMRARRRRDLTISQIA
jgi:PEP-CTERM motif